MPYLYLVKTNLRWQVTSHSAHNLAKLLIKGSIIWKLHPTTHWRRTKEGLVQCCFLPLLPKPHCLGSTILWFIFKLQSEISKASQKASHALNHGWMPHLILDFYPSSWRWETSVSTSMSMASWPQGGFCCPVIGGVGSGRRMVQKRGWQGSVELLERVPANGGNVPNCW